VLFAHCLFHVACCSVPSEPNPVRTKFWHEP